MFFAWAQIIEFSTTIWNGYRSFGSTCSLGIWNSECEEPGGVAGTGGGDEGMIDGELRAMSQPSPLPSVAPFTRGCYSCTTTTICVWLWAERLSPHRDDAPTAVPYPVCLLSTATGSRLKSRQRVLNCSSPDKILVGNSSTYGFRNNIKVRLHHTKLK